MKPDKILAAAKGAGLLQPWSKAKKLRALLPALQAFMAAGDSQAKCMKFLEEQGLVYKTAGEYRNALFRARKAGPLMAAEWSVVLASPVSSVSGEQNTPTTPSPLTGEQHVTSRAGSLSEPSEGKKSKLIRVERKERLTNPEPSMEDFV